MDEQQLIVKAKKGNNIAFINLIEKYQSSLYCTALSIMGSSWDAYDMVQETLLKAYTSLQTLRDNKSFKFWLTQILVNKCYDQHRKMKRVFPSEDLNQLPYEFTGREEHLDLLEAIKGLDEKYRTVISLRYFQDLPLKEIALLLKCPEGTVKSRLSQALKELRKNLNYNNEGVLK